MSAAQKCLMRYLKMYANYTSKESIRHRAIQARYGTKAKEIKTTPETLKGKAVPTSLINAIPYLPFWKLFTSRSIYRRKKKISFLKSEECLPLKTTWQNSLAFNPSLNCQCSFWSMFNSSGRRSRRESRSKVGSLRGHWENTRWPYTGFLTQQAVVRGWHTVNKPYNFCPVLEDWAIF